MTKISCSQISEDKYIAEYDNSDNNFSEESIKCCLKNLNLDAYGYISYSSTFWGKKTFKKGLITFSVKIIESFKDCSSNKIVIQCQNGKFVEYIFHHPELFDVNTTYEDLEQKNNHPVRRIMHCH